MGVQGLQHAGDRGFDHLLVRGLIHVLRADAFEHVAEQVEQAVGLFRVLGVRRRGRRRLLRCGRMAEERQSAQHRGSSQSPHARNLHHSMCHPLTLSLRDANHGKGLIGCPLRRSST